MLIFVLLTRMLKNSKVLKVLTCQDNPPWLLGGPKEKPLLKKHRSLALGVGKVHLVQLKTRD